MEVSLVLTKFSQTQTTHMDAAELLKRYAVGERHFLGVCMIGANLSGANLSGANLHNADLSDANLFDTDLSGSDLGGADLSDAILHGINLISANLNRANLNRANLVCANLSEANLSDADLSSANLSEANLSNADLSRANLSNTHLRNANLSRANLSQSVLIGANIIGANLFKTVLTNANLSEAKIDGTILAYQKVAEELQQENQVLREKLSLLETQFEKLVEKQVERRLIANQGIKAKKSLTWEGMRFRSNPEREIAKIFDEMGVMFFPLPSVRVMTEEGMKTREVDFLVCSRGKWGILECDGISHILNSIKKGQMPSAALDHKRDNDFNRHGQWFIKRFTDEECKKNPRKVVRQFLDMLHKFHEDQDYIRKKGSTEIETSLLLALLLTINDLTPEDSLPKNNVDSPNLFAKKSDDKETNTSSNELVSPDNIPIEISILTVLESTCSSLSSIIKHLEK